MIARIRPETRYPHLLGSLFPGTDYIGLLRESLQGYFNVDGVFLTQGARVGLCYLLKALPHRKVYLPAYTCWAVPDAIRHAGKEAVFVDISLEDYNMDLEKLADTLTPGSIVLATHQFGIPCDIEEISALARERDCLVLEDNAAGFGAMCHGRKTGSFAPASIISFETSKTLTCGRGGAVLFNDGDLFKRVQKIYQQETRPTRYDQSIRQVGSLTAYLLMTSPALFPVTHWAFDRVKGETSGYPPPESSLPDKSYRLRFDNRRARLAYCGMQEIQAIIKRKTEVAAYYGRELAACEKLLLPVCPDYRQPVYMRFPVRVVGMNKQDFYRRCVRRGLDLAFTFSYSCAPGRENAPNAHLAADSVLNLPIYSKLTDDDLEKIKTAVLATCAS